MAIINCPNCKKKVSDKATHCDNCDLDLQQLDHDKLKKIRHIHAIEQSQRLTTLSFIALLLFCGGFLLIYWQHALPGSKLYEASIGAIVLGVSLYLYARIRIIIFKRNNK